MGQLDDAASEPPGLEPAPAALVPATAVTPLPAAAATAPLVPAAAGARTPAVPGSAPTPACAAGTVPAVPDGFGHVQGPAIPEG